MIIAARFSIVEPGERGIEYSQRPVVQLAVKIRPDTGLFPPAETHVNCMPVTEFRRQCPPGKIPLYQIGDSGEKRPVGLAFARALRVPYSP